MISGGISYRIHRNLTKMKADAVAGEIKALMKTQGIRSVIFKAERGT